jgi:tetratricopeptide (TPR) repeat protein
MLSLAAGAAVVVAASMWSNMHDRHEQAELALYDGQQQLQRGQDSDLAIKMFERGLALVEHQPFERDLREQLRQQLAQARRLHVAEQLHALADQIRVLYGGLESIPPERSRSLATQCEAFWQQREAIIKSLGGAAAAAHESEVATDLKDIAIFTAAAAAAATTTTTAAEPNRALALLDEVEAAFGPSAVLERERQQIQQTNGHSFTLSSSLSPRTAWEHLALGRALLASRDFAGAEREFAAAKALDPAAPWPNFYYGACAYQLGRYDDAIAAFSVCIGASPNVAAYFHNRALAYAAMGRTTDAMRDYDRALQLDPAHAASARNRDDMLRRGLSNKSDANN